VAGEPAPAGRLTLQIAVRRSLPKHRFRSPVAKRRHSYCFSNTCTLPSDPIPVIVFPSSDTVVLSVKVVISALASKS